MKYLLIGIILGSASMAVAQIAISPKKDSVSNFDRSINMSKIDSLKEVLVNSNSKQRFDIQFELFGRYLSVDAGIASRYLDSCIIAASERHDSLLIVKTLHAKGYVLKNYGDLKGAMEKFEFALGVAKRNDYRDQIKYILNSLALVSTSIASFDKALHYNLESLKIREKEGNIRDISTTLNNIGLVYEGLDDFENAILYYEKSYKLKVEHDIKYDLDRTIINIGGILNRLNRYKESESMVVKVFLNCKNLGCRPDIMAQACLVLGISYLGQGKHRLSQEYLMMSLQSQKKIEDSDRLCMNYYWLAKLSHIQGRVGVSLDFLEASQRIAIKSGLQKRAMDNYDLYATIYSSMNNFEKAYSYQKRFSDLNTEILNGNLVRKITTIQTEFKERENNAKILIQSEIMTFQEEAIRQHRILNWLIGLMAMLLITIVFVLFKSNKQKLAINRMLDKGVRDRTSELEKSRDELQHAHDEQRIVLRKLSSDFYSTWATFKGLSDGAERDRLPEHAIYFRQAEATSERIMNDLKRYSDLGKIDGGYMSNRITNLR